MEVSLSTEEWEQNLYQDIDTDTDDDAKITDTRVMTSNKTKSLSKKYTPVWSGDDEIFVRNSL